MEGIQKYIQKISSKTGEDKVSIDKPSRVAHRISYGTGIPVTRVTACDIYKKMPL